MFHCFREEEDQFDNMKRKLQVEISDINFLKDTLERQKSQLDGEVTSARAEINGLKTTVAHMTSAQAGVAAELESTKVSTSTGFFMDQNKVTLIQI